MLATHIVQELYSGQDIVAWEVYQSTPAGRDFAGTFPTRASAEAYRAQLQAADQRLETD